jgi:hypothetical protein
VVTFEPNFITLISIRDIQAISFFLLFIYMTGAFRIFAPYISYQLNYQYISTVLCENKDKPVMDCKGKCQLNKEIKKNAEEEAKKQPALQNIQAEEIPSEKPYYTTPRFYLLKEVSYASYSEQYLSNALSHITPPPKA